MKRKKTAFKESLLECVLGYRSRANWRYARPNSDVITFDVDVTTCVALISHKHPSRKTFLKSIPVPKLPKNALFCYSENINRICH